MKIVVTVVGKDRVGIIATVSSLLAENRNIMLWLFAEKFCLMQLFLHGIADMLICFREAHAI